ncbi:MAG: hypothetical protein ABI588_01125 [Arenimonas sp.]
MTAYHLTVMMHVSLGVAALLSFWVAALAKKGSRPHKLAGKVYMLVMAGLLLPAIPLSWRVLQNLSLSFGLFLFYLLVITGTALWRGWSSVRRKRDFATYASAGLRRLGWVNIGTGAAVLGLGAALAQPILLGFSLVGILGGKAMVELRERGPAHPRWWMAEHLGAMLGCGVATHIAFLLIGLPRLLPAAWNGAALQTFGWLAPLAVAALARVWLGRKYLPAAPKPQSPRTISPLSTLSTLRREA